MHRSRLILGPPLLGGATSALLLAATVASPSAAAGSDDDLATLALREVVALHEFIADWSTGALADDDATYRRFSEALAEDFVLVGPDGGRMGSADVVAGFRGAHGRWRGESLARVEVRGARVRALAEPLVLVEYEEWHRVGERTSARRSSVLMRRDPSAPGDVAWVHLHETWIAAVDGAADASEGGEGR
ncbi:MAG: DUF4440 domain-containing protein [Acidobacteria bacterium]|nr:MAG: DUF4440 domain-containing protein [Acidobacteriota bacterium]REK03879.1 MAG: DUF4440 domain-containing protein [Acidobacteriota bacterium]